jgi:hypothetical protein
VKIIGTNSPIFLDSVTQVTIKHFSNFNTTDLTHKLSQKNNFLAITVIVFAENQQMLDAFYQELTKIPDVKMVL